MPRCSAQPKAAPRPSECLQQGRAGQGRAGAVFATWPPPTALYWFCAVLLWPPPQKAYWPGASFSRPPLMAAPAPPAVLR